MTIRAENSGAGLNEDLFKELAAAGALFASFAVNFMLASVIAATFV